MGNPFKVVEQRTYLALGLGCFTVKYGLDWAVARFVFGREWLPWNYLAPVRYYEVWSVPPEDANFLLTLVALSIPFMAIGVLATLGRLRSADLPPALALLFFVPAVNLVFFLTLAAVPARVAPDSVVRASNDGQAAGHDAGEPVPKAPALPTWKYVLLRAGLPAAVCVATVASAIYLATPAYAWGMFFLLPCLMGVISGWHGAQLDGGRTTFGRDILWGGASLIVGGVALLVLALEGALCLLMAFPLAVPPLAFGVVIGEAMGSRRYGGAVPCSGVAAMLMMVAADMRAPGPLPVNAVVTTIEVEAPPEVVWRYVTEFPPLPPPEDWLFHLGVAYPVSATIEGTGPGAVRYCNFSTGAFVEPIEVWDEPRLLHFRVETSPPTMRELSLYDHVHAPHLSGYLESRRGQFLLEPLPGGRTRLEGTTWYTNRMWPQAYWSTLASAIIHRIHKRVLIHVKACAEGSHLADAGGRPGGPAAAR